MEEQQRSTEEELPVAVSVDDASVEERRIQELQERIEARQQQQLEQEQLNIPVAIPHDETMQQQERRGAYGKLFIRSCFFGAFGLVAVAGLVVGLIFGLGSDSKVAPGSIQSPTTAPSPFVAKCFDDTDELRVVVDQFLSGDYRHADTYGLRLGDWCVSKISDFSSLFSVDRNPIMSTFNENISAWDMSSATDTSFMFRDAERFNQELSMWNVSSVVDTSHMFRGASLFDGDISAWNVSNVQTMGTMFFHASAFNQDLSLWDVSQVQDTSHMFRGASSFNRNISAWNVSRVQRMNAMFYQPSTFNQDLSGWNVSRVQDIKSMFYGASLFDQDISAWNVSKVQTMRSMFDKASAFNQDLSGWNVHRVQDTSWMFFGASLFDQNLSAWNVSSVEAMDGMFSGASKFDQNLSSWNTSQVQVMNQMFHETSFNGDVSAWDVGNVETTQWMFSDAVFFQSRYIKLECFRSDRSQADVSWCTIIQSKPLCLGPNSFSSCQRLCNVCRYVLSIDHGPQSNEYPAWTILSLV